jgi:hypothetical protein
MGQYYQRSFVGGMDMLSKDTDIAVNAYRYGVNMRQRYGYAQAIQKSTDITYNLPPGNFQGLIGVGNIWVAFVNGNAYYMPITGDTWYQVPFFSLDATVEFIYFCAVPGATNNYLRQAVVTQTTTDGVTTSTIDASAGIIQTPFTTQGTPAGLVCQDGLNQPWLITYDAVNNNATARLLGTYSQWDNSGTTSNNQEYVPIGKMMMYMSPILYIVAPDNKSIYRSVSGAPLNFMVNVDVDGDKLATESLGGAATTSFAFDFDPITSIAISTTANTFIVSSNRTIYGATPDTTTTIFGEPTFDVAFTLLAGIINHVSMVDMNGDTAFIDFEGVKKFNAVSQLKFSGRNDPFSKNLSGAIDGILQRQPCAFTFNNFNFFSLLTTFGNCLAVFDNYLQLWVGFDITNATLGGVKQFAQADYLDTSYLAGVTYDNRIWQFYTEEETETAYIQLRAYVSGQYIYGTFFPDSLSKEHKITNVRAAITNGVEAGTFSFIEYVDNQRGELIQRDIDGVTESYNYPVFPPILPAVVKRFQNITFPPQSPLEGYKISPIIQWDCDCNVEQIMVNTSAEDAIVSPAQQQKMLAGTL